MCVIVSDNSLCVLCVRALIIRVTVCFLSSYVNVSSAVLRSIMQKKILIETFLLTADYKVKNELSSSRNLNSSLKTQHKII